MNEKDLKAVPSRVSPMKDLVVLVADKDAEETIKSLLGRSQSLGIRPITFECVRHPRHDPGCVTQAAPFLEPYRSFCQYALVVLDHEGSGRENQSREKLEEEIVASLDTKCWQSGCVEAIVISPELEAWVWSNSPHVASILGWEKNSHPSTTKNQTIKQWILEHKPDYWNPDDEKPIRPKETMEETLFQAHLAWSASLFKKLAETVSLKGCTDLAYNKLVDTLQSWFPTER